MSPKKKVTTKKSIERTSSNKKMEVNVSAKDYINPKNYLYAFLLLVGSVLITIVLFNWYNAKTEEKLLKSYLIASNTIQSSIKDLNSIEQIRQESPSAYFIYAGYTKDEDVYNFEKKLKKVIDKYKLNDIFYYIDLTEYKEKDDNYLELLKNSLKVDNIKSLPAIIYVQDGEVKEVLDGVNDTKLKIADFEELLDIYGFEAIK